MSLSIKTRFQVFKRDLFKCQYCGSTPPNVILEVDHILAISRGGSDAFSNLATSCFECNRGKSAGLLSDKPAPILEMQAVEEEKFLQFEAFNKFLKSKRLKENKWIQEIASVYVYTAGRDARYGMSRSFENSCRIFLKHLPCERIIEALNVATSRRHGLESDYDKRYFFGICWKMIREAKEGKQ